MNRSACAAGLSLAALAPLAACGPASDRSVTLTLVVDSEPASLDPRLGSDEASRRVNDLLYNGLVRLDDAARPIPDLAAAWRRPDPLTVEVALRPGVLFHDGSTLTARDVVATYRSILENEVPSFRRGDLSEVASVTEDGELRVLFRLKRPFAPILSELNVPILRAGAGPDAERRPIGTGPFRLRRYRRDEDLLLERFDRYFEGPAGVPLLRLRFVPSETERLLELLKGSADLIVNDLSPDQIARVRGTKGYVVDSRPGRNCVYLAFNLRDPILGRREVRQAIARTVDRRSIVEHLLHGTASLATGLLPPGHWAFNPDVPRYDPDPGAAAALLDAAGFPDPDGPGPEPRLTVTCTISGGELALQQATILQAQLRSAGIAVAIRPFDWPTFYDDLKAGRFQMAMSNWTEIGDPDVYRLRFHSRYVPPAGFNRGGYSDPEADRLIDAGAAALDDETRRRIYGRLQAILARDLPYLCLWHRDVTAARRLRVLGFRLTSGGDFAPLRGVSLGPTVPPAPGPGADRRGSSSPGSSGDVPGERPFEGAERDRPRADHARRVDRHVEDRRGDPSPGGAAVQDEVHLPPEGRGDLVRGGGRRRPGTIGARGDDRSPGRERQGGGDRVGGDSNPDGLAATQQARREARRGGQDQRQRPRPELGGEAERRRRHLANAEAGRFHVGGDQRQRHSLRSPLGLEDALDRLRIARVGPEAVEGLRRIDHESPGAQQLRGLLQDGAVRPLRIDPQDPLHDPPACVGSVATTISYLGLR
jgi:peptide/nickel transport system substrate-binding protein